MIQLSLRKLVGKKVSITTGIATFRDLKGTVVSVSEAVLELREEDGRTVFIPLNHCGLVRIEGRGESLFKTSNP